MERSPKEEYAISARLAHVDSLSSIDRVIAIDWSGRVDTAGQRRHIFAAIWTSAGAAITRARFHKPEDSPSPSLNPSLGSVRLEAGRTREEVADWLIDLARDTPRLVVGFDFCFSFPEWFVRDEMGCATAPEFWQSVATEHGERWLARGYEDRRFWGKPHKRPAEFSGDLLHRMLRATDIDCKLAAHIPEVERAARIKGITPKSVFQIGGSGSVGTASLRGMPILLKLREAGFRVWPFDLPALAPPALASDPPQPLVVEMYSRLNTGPVHKSNPEKRAAYLAQKRREDPAYGGLSRSALATARASEDAFDALVSCMVMTARRSEFATLPTPADPCYKVEGWTWAPGVSPGVIPSKP